MEAVFEITSEGEYRVRRCIRWVFYFRQALKRVDSSHFFVDEREGDNKKWVTEVWEVIKGMR